MYIQITIPSEPLRSPIEATNVFSENMGELTLLVYL